MEASAIPPPRPWRPPLLMRLLMALGESLCRTRGLAGGISAAGMGRWRERVEVRKSLGQAQRLRLAYASDLHAGRMTPSGTISAAVEALLEAGPDLILLGGDFVCSRAEELQAILPSLGRLRAPAGVFAVMGNHDHSADVGTITAQLEAIGIRVLRNRSVRLAEPFGNVLLVGLDDHLGGRPCAAAARWDASCVTVLLIHQPSGLLDAGDRPFDLALAGHTHGGQITLPGGVAPIAASGPLSRRYQAGRYPLGPDQVLCVSVGVGQSVLPLRLGPRSEVLILDLISVPATTSPA
jgi:predicted MPP superfamily phosphohydrolase